MLAMVSLPFFLQSMMGRSEVETGLLLTPWPLATMVMAPLAGYLIEKVHAGLLGAIGLLVMACGLFGLALLPSAPTDLDIIWRMALCGAGFGLFQSPNNHTIVSSAPAHRSGGASGMLGTARLLGQSTVLRGKSFDITGKRRNLTGIRGITGFTLFGYLIPVKEKLSRSAKLLILLLKSLHWSKGGVQNQFYHTSK